MVLATVLVFTTYFWENEKMGGFSMGDYPERESIAKLTGTAI